MANNKKQLGQFYTTNSDYILSGLELPDKKNHVVEPFVGDGDLIKWLKAHHQERLGSLKTYDIDPSIGDGVIIQDTLRTPPYYKDKFVITNPPFLARNKNKDKTLYDLHDTNDLYKAFLKTIIEGDVEGGIIILPLNFLCSNDNKIRNMFFEKYHITSLNIFEEAVFDDTTYTVCSLSFFRGPQTKTVPTNIYPSKKRIDLDLKKEWGWRPAGYLYEVPRNGNYTISRLVKGDIPKGYITNLYLRAVDSGGNDKRIALVVKDEPYYGKNTDRVFATLVCNHKINNEQLVAEQFNKRLEDLREEHHSLFLINYRNSSSSYARKRISFRMAYNMVANILEELEST
jgi:hypothetical protein